MIRPARPADALETAQLHVAAWAETYPDLLPAERIAAMTVERRLERWHAALEAGTTRILLAPGRGFGQIGPQRQEDLRAGGWAEEVITLYTLRATHGSGLGTALLSGLLGPAPATVHVLEGNDRAIAFYEKSGGRLLGRRTSSEDGLTDRVYGFGDPSA